MLAGSVDTEDTLERIRGGKASERARETGDSRVESRCKRSKEDSGCRGEGHGAVSRGPGSAHCGAVCTGDEKTYVPYINRPRPVVRWGRVAAQQRVQSRSSFYLPGDRSMFLRVHREHDTASFT